MYRVRCTFNLLSCGVAMVMERGVIRCIDDLNGVGWMISGWGRRGRGISGQVIGHTSGHIAMMICTMILERERENNILHK